MSSVFTRIIQGELPCYKIAEDEYTFSFLSLHPIQLGHTLVVPKLEVDHVIDVPEPYYSSVFAAALPIAKAIYQVTGCRRVGSLIQGFEVAHFHYHLVPMYDNSDLDFKKAREASQEEMQSMAEKLVKELSQ